MKRFLAILCAGILAAGIAGGYRWHAYVTNTDSPFDEVGIDLNNMMPGPIKAWGCGRLKQTFGGKTLPPYGCSGPDGRGWL